MINLTLRRQGLSLMILILLSCTGSFAQSVPASDHDPSEEEPAVQKEPSAEFPKGFVIYLNLQQGVVSNFKTTPDYYQIGLTFNPQYTIIPSRLRVGLLGAGIYTQGRWTAQGGPNVALRLCDMKAGVFGSVLNLQLLAGHYWGAFKQKLAGGGFQLEIAQAFTIGITTYRDYGNDQWWMQSTIGINFLGFKRKSSDPFNP